jgi:integrative and conjugative element protein (TIGR02256 family)
MSHGHDWITPCRGYALRVTSASWQQIDRECDRSGAIETGGILVGHYTTDEVTAVVTEALPPPKDSARGRSWFHRGVAGLRGLLAKRWENQRRTYYVGEWHYHPASIVEPSGDDLAQMYGINTDPRYRCSEPIMLIVGRARDGDEPPVRAFVFPHGRPFLEFLRHPKP